MACATCRCRQRRRGYGRPFGVAVGRLSLWYSPRACAHFTLLCGVFHTALGRRANLSYRLLVGGHFLGMLMMLMKKNKLLTFLALAVAVAIGGLSADQSTGQPTTAPQFGPWGFDLTGMDRQAKPGDSFFDYASGAWDARTVIPPDKASFGMFVALRDKTDEQIRTIIDAAATSGASPVTDVGKLRALCNAFMGEARIEQRDVAPITDDLNKIRAAKTRADIADLRGRARGGGFGASLFSVGVSEDQKDPTRHALYA